MDSIMAETERLAYFTVVHALDLNSLHRSSNSHSGDVKTEQRLQACVLKMLERHSIVFSGMMQRLHISRSVNFRDSFSEISEELFKDEVSWSKIVALFVIHLKDDIFVVQFFKLIYFPLIFEFLSSCLS